MAHITKKGKAWKHILKDASGKLGSLVVKQYKNQIVIAACPTGRLGKTSPLQKYRESTFKEGVAYARKINNNPAKRAAYQKYVGDRTNVYQAALSDFMKGVKVKL